MPDQETETLTAAEIAAVLKAYRGAGSSRRRRGEALVRGRTTHDDRGALDRPASRRAARVAMAGRRDARAARSTSGSSSSATRSRRRRAARDAGRSRSARSRRRRSRSSSAASRHRAPESIVFSHPALGTPLDPSKLTGYSRKAIKRAGITKPFRPWHGLRHTALTETAAAGVPAMFVQAKAGHAQGSTTERTFMRPRRATPTWRSSPRRGCSDRRR